jgi:hypothetical protein
MIKYTRSALSLAALILCVNLFFIPYNYYLIISAAIVFLPLVVLATLLNRESFELITTKYSVNLGNPNRVNLCIPLSVVSGFLFLRALKDFQVINGLYFISCVIILSIVLALITWGILKHSNFWLIAVVVCSFYSYSLVLNVNNLGTASKVSFVQGTISTKFRQKGGVYTIVISENKLENQVNVKESEYENLRVGLEACAKDSSGLLGIITRKLTSCGASPTHPSGVTS